MFFKNRLKKSTEEQEKQFAKMLEENQVSFKDKLAMVLSAYLMILLPCVLILLAFAGLILLVFNLL